jgi:hypothetical protein
MVRKNLGFRTWFYFRMGWGTYFAFIFAAINTLTVTYYLAIERVPILKEVFPSFIHYVLILGIVGIPLLVLIGWVHYRRTAAYGSEAEVQIESNPYMYKIAPGWQKEVMFPLLQKILELSLKNMNNEKLTENEIKEITILQEKLDILVKGGSIGSPRGVSLSGVDKN